MADVPIGAVPKPEVTVAPAKAPVSARAAKLAALNAGLRKLNVQGETPGPATEAPPPAPPADAPTEPAPVEPKNEPPPLPSPPDEKLPEAPKEPPKGDDAPADDKTARGLAQIDRATKRFREEQKQAKAEFERREAELARREAAIAERSSSDDSLRELARRDPAALLERLGVASEDDWDAVGRQAYLRTKAGKADPKAKPSVDALQSQRAQSSEVAELRQQVSELTNYLKQQQQQQQAQAFVSSWQDSAVKAIPADKPTLIAKLHAKSPDKARAALLEIGQRLERENDNETPTHADVIAEYERVRRAELEEAGVDVDALLRPTTIKAPVAAAPARTLDPTAVTGTRPVNGHQTKTDRIAQVSAGLRREGLI